MTPDVSPISWDSWRFIPAKFEEKRILRKLAEDDDDFEAISELEGMTNERLRQERGEAALVPQNEVVTGKGSEYIMAPFTYRNPEGSRFSDGTYGVYCAALRRDTALEESKFHREAFLKHTKENPMRLEMRAIRAELAGRLHDIRGMKKRIPKVYDLKDYKESQALARDLVKLGSAGIVYDSVRHKGGQCAGVFKPSVLKNARPTEQVVFEWDGKTIAKTYEMRET